MANTKFKNPTLAIGGQRRGPTGTSGGEAISVTHQEIHWCPRKNRAEERERGDDACTAVLQKS